MSGIFFTCLQTNFSKFVCRYLIQLCNVKSVTLSSKSANSFVSLPTNFPKVCRLDFADLLHKCLQTWLCRLDFADLTLQTWLCRLVLVNRIILHGKSANFCMLVGKLWKVSLQTSKSFKKFADLTLPTWSNSLQTWLCRLDFADLPKTVEKRKFADLLERVTVLSDLHVGKKLENVCRLTLIKVCRLTKMFVD